MESADCKSGQESFTLQPMDKDFEGVKELRVLSDGNRVFTATGSHLQIWDSSKKVAVQTVILEGKGLAFAVSPDGKLAAALEFNRTNGPPSPNVYFRLYSLESGRKVSEPQYKSHSGSEKLVFLDGKTIVIGQTWNDELWFFDAISGAEQMVVRTQTNTLVKAGEKKGAERFGDFDICNLATSSGLLAVQLENGKIMLLRLKK